MTNDSIRLFENEEFGSVRAFQNETGEPVLVANEKDTQIVRTPGGNQRIMAEVA